MDISRLRSIPINYSQKLKDNSSTVPRYIQEVSAHIYGLGAPLSTSVYHVTGKVVEGIMEFHILASFLCFFFFKIK